MTNCDLISKDGKLSLIETLVQSKIVVSNGEAKRLIQGGGVKVNGDLVKDSKLELSPGEYSLSVGQRTINEIKIKVG